MKYIKGLDSLRAFAVLVVLIRHWTQEDTFGPINGLLYKGLFPPARFGVDLFFVLSGFLITSILLDANESGESRPNIIKTFIIRRTLRIFPIYYATIAILLCIGFPFVREHVWWFLTYTSNILCFRQVSWNQFGHTWSLSVEEQFYLVWPWLMIFVHPRYLKYVFYLAIGIGVASTVGFRLQSDPPNTFSLLLMPACLHAFGIGGLYAYFSRDAEKKKQFVKVMNICFPIALLCHFYWGFSVDGGHFNFYYRIADVIISIWLIHHVIVIRDGWVKRNIVENRVLMGIGRISYGIYLYHYMVPIIYRTAVRGMFSEGSSVRNILLSNPVSFFICLTFILVFAWLSFEYFEKKFLGLKKYFVYGKDRAVRKASLSQ